MASVNRLSMKPNEFPMVLEDEPDERFNRGFTCHCCSKRRLKVIEACPGDWNGRSICCDCLAFLSQKINDEDSD